MQYGSAIDFNSLANFFSLPIDVILEQLLLNIGWIPLAVVFLWGCWHLWINYIQGQYASVQKFVLLAIDVPRGNEQGPKAVENLFSYLSGAHGTKNLIETYWEGQFQLCISLEIVSIEGYTQFLIRTPIAFRSLVETAVYSQYPDAEITEVDDYTVGMPISFPDDEYDIAGCEFTLSNNQVYPIKTYSEFETVLGAPGTQYKDTMATLMDLCSSLKKGEQLWFQIVIKPIDMDWGIKAGEKETAAIMEKAKIKDSPYALINLTPKQKLQLEAIQKKTSKNGFECKPRFVYIAKKDVMNKPKVLNGFVGYMKQFINADTNNLKPDMKVTGTSAHYFWKNYRLNSKKTYLIKNYISRSNWSGLLPKVLNIEELATVWHFPVEMVVKAPLVQKAPGRKAGPPMALPVLEAEPQKIEVDHIFEQRNMPKDFFTSENRNEENNDIDGGESKIPVRQAKAPAGISSAPPANLPFA